MNICLSYRCNKPVKGNYKLCFKCNKDQYVNECINCSNKIKSNFELCYDCNLEKPKQKCLF